MDRVGAVCVFWSLLFFSVYAVPAFRVEYSNYLGIIDAGSTGSRFYLFKISRNAEKEITKMVEVYSDECQPGINSYKNDLDHVWAPLYKLIKGSESRISPPARNIPLYIYATAGMRVLSKSDQNAIYNAIFSHYLQSDLVFYMKRNMLQTIDGEMEALYGWITVNVLNNRITPSLRYTAAETIGSLDLGGESTQIAYQHVSRSAGEPVDFAHDIFSKSFLSFGAKEAQFRYENYIMSNRAVLRAAIDSRTNKLNVPNPCSHPGLVGATPTYEGLYHEGTGNLEECEAILTRLLQGESECIDTAEHKCSLWSLPIPQIRGDFVAMSLYFYVIDFVKAAYLLEEAAHPSVEELKSYGRSFCAMRWSEVKATFGGKHRFTSEAVLKQRCFQIAYIVTLLEQGYRLNGSEVDGAPHAVAFLKTINGESVDWTYGAALYKGRNPVPKPMRGVWAWVAVCVVLGVGGVWA